MKSIFSIIDEKTMLNLNLVSIFITTICEVFVIFIFMTKGQTPDLVHWKYVAIIIGLVVVSLLFLGSLASLFLFFRMKKKKKNT
jgi:ABC-type polysaccharide/polyol phosphate export permease